MKTKILLSLIVFASHFISAQNLEITTNLNLSQPVGMMKHNMDNAFGLSLDASYRFKTPFSAGLEVSFGSYAQQTTRQQYTFDDGSVTETDVNVNNNVFSIYLTGKHFLRPGKKVNPYLSGKAGLTSFATKLYIEDPEDETNCHPLESDILSRDNTYSFSGGVGARIDFKTLFKNTAEEKLYFDVSIHGTHGGIVKYMNVDMQAHQHTPDQDVVAKFINTQTQVIHEHHVGYVYSSVLSMVDFKLGVVFKPGFR